MKHPDSHFIKIRLDNLKYDVENAREVWLKARSEASKAYGETISLTWLGGRNSITTNNGCSPIDKIYPKSDESVGLSEKNKREKETEILFIKLRNEYWKLEEEYYKLVKAGN